VLGVENLKRLNHHNSEIVKIKDFIVILTVKVNGYQLIEVVLLILITKADRLRYSVKYAVNRK